ncbi:MAG TPA: hypothetical protein VFW55_02545, partial [Propionicimonas sp.]|nr:hypothetical protein [Propionicimonas sp.]
MNDLEERLRADLTRAVEPIDDNLDTEGLLSSAHRARDTRRTRQAVAAVALSLVGGLVVWAGASLTSLPGVAPMIATPLPVPSATPSDSITPTRSPRDWSGHTGSLSLDTSDLSGLAAVGLRALVVQSHGTPGSDVVVTGTRKTGEPISRSGVVTASSPFLAKLTDEVWVMITPGKVRWAEGAAGGGLAGATVGDLDGLGVIVVMGEPQVKLAGFIWQGTDGKAWNDRGVRAPSAELSLDGRTYWFAHDPDLGVACSGELRAGEGNGSPDECGFIHNLGESGRGGSGADGWEERLFVALPKGATEATVGASEQCTSASASLDPGGRTVILLSCRGA